MTEPYKVMLIDDDCGVHTLISAFWKMRGIHIAAHTAAKKDWKCCRPSTPTCCCST